MKTPINEGVIRTGDLTAIPAKVVDELRRIVESAYDDVSRNVKKAKHTAEDAIDESRYGIKRRPLTAVGTAALAGLILGFTLGWAAASNNRK